MKRLFTTTNAFVASCLVLLNPLSVASADDTSFLSGADIFEDATPGVVYITTFADIQDEQTGKIYKHIPFGAGTGFIWDDEGHVVTNYHVMEDAVDAMITITSRPEANVTEDGSLYGELVKKEYNCTLVGLDPGMDIAVLKIVSEDILALGLHPLPRATLKESRVGDPAYAIGNPFGLDHSMSAGIVSGMKREEPAPSGRPIENVVQTDATINPGNSGGPLMNGRGQVIGINYLGMFSGKGGGGVGFAIPIDAAEGIVATLMEKGEVLRPGLNLTFVEENDTRSMGIMKGLLVLTVHSKELKEAGLKGTKVKSSTVYLGSVILGVEGEKVNSLEEILSVYNKLEIGQKIELTVGKLAKKKSPFESPKFETSNVTVTVTGIIG